MGLTVKRPRGITQTGWFLRGTRSAWFDLCFYSAQRDAWHGSAVQEISVDVKDENIYGLYDSSNRSSSPDEAGLTSAVREQGWDAGCTEMRHIP